MKLLFLIEFFSVWLVVLEYDLNFLGILKVIESFFFYKLVVIFCFLSIGFNLVELIVFDFGLELFLFGWFVIFIVFLVVMIDLEVFDFFFCCIWLVLEFGFFLIGLVLFVIIRFLMFFKSLVCDFVDVNFFV